MNSLSIARRAVRFVMTAALAVGFMAAGYSNREASAAVNARGSVVVPVRKRTALQYAFEPLLGTLRTSGGEH